jgi:hypothetical protein
MASINQHIITHRMAISGHSIFKASPVAFAILRKVKHADVYALGDASLAILF